MRHVGPHRRKQHAHRHDGEQRPQVQIRQRPTGQPLPPAHHHIAQRTRQRNRKAAGRTSRYGLGQRHATAVQERHCHEAASGAEERRQDPDAGAHGCQPQAPRQPRRHIRLHAPCAPQHPAAHPPHEECKSHRQHLSGQPRHDARAQLPPHQDARRQQPDQMPLHRPLAVMRPHAGQRREHDGGQRRGQCRLHHQGRVVPRMVKDHHQEGHQHHAAPHAQQASQKTATAAHQQQHHHGSCRHLSSSASFFFPCVLPAHGWRHVCAHSSFTAAGAQTPIGPARLAHTPAPAAYCAPIGLGRR